ncbi:MAG: transcriptional regulator [Rhodospirillales bacterium]|jgi:DNA-binding transcriptional LysR family regulator|nr:transcriptional regulator [Rhodospirillales bacterium]
MRWRFEDLSTFLSVVEAGGISAAARRLNLSKSLISKRVSDLEADLGTQLLQRTTRAIRATPDGEALIERMGPLVREMSEAAEQIAGGGGRLTGRLRIAVPMSFGTMYLAPILASFAAQNPALELAIDLDDKRIDLVPGGYDAAIRIGTLPDSTLIARQLCTEARLVVCSPVYKKTRGLPTGIADLANHACIDYSNLHTSQLWQFEPARPGGRARTVALASRIVANNGEVMREMAIAGLGLATLPLFICARALKDGTLIDAMPGVRPAAAPIHAVYPQTKKPSAKVRAFVDHMVAAFANGAPWENPTKTKPKRHGRAHACLHAADRVTRPSTKAR